MLLLGKIRRIMLITPREIIDESDVFIDVHKAIRRMHPAPRTRVPKGTIVTTDTASNTGKAEEELDGTAAQDSLHNAVRRVSTQDVPPRQKANSLDMSGSPKATFLMRRTSGASNIMDRGMVSRRIDAPELREHLKHLGPSNLASRPRATRYNTVKIKAGGGTTSDSPLKDVQRAPQNVESNEASVDGGIGEGLVPSAGIDAKDGVHAVQVGYGTIERPKSSESPDTSNKGTQVRTESLQRPSSARASSQSSFGSTSTIRSLPRQENRLSSLPHSAREARSGSITENVVETGGIKKVILEPTSSSSEEGQSPGAKQSDENMAVQGANGAKKKRRKKRKKTDHSESTPLLDGNH